MAKIPVCSTVAAADTNATSLAVSKECAPTGATKWLYMEPNEISSFSPGIETTARNPISIDRQNRKGTITSLTAEPGFDADTVQDMMAYFADSFLYSTWKTPTPDVDGLKVTATTTTGYTVASDGLLAAGTLVYASGFAMPENNGLKTVGAASTGTEVKIAGLVVETAPASARLRIAGVVGAAGDLAVDVDGAITSTALNFTTLGLNVGQMVHVGGATAGSKFTVVDNYGLARVSEIAANKLVLDQTEQPFTVDAGAGQSVQLLFQAFVRNVSVDNADFQKVQHTMEARFNTNPASFIVARECYANTLEVSFPVEDKSTLSLGFIGRDIEAPSAAASLGLARDNQALTEAFNTASDFMRLRVQDIDGLGVSSYFRDTTISIDNGAAAETVLGTLGAAFVNLGNFGVTLSTEALFTDGAVLAAIRNNTTVSLQAGLRNNDGGFVLDLPALTLGDGALNLSRDEKVKVTLTGDVFKDPVLGYSMGVSLFSYLPPTE